jgi:hypothetical protein
VFIKNVAIAGEDSGGLSRLVLGRIHKLLIIRQRLGELLDAGGFTLQLIVELVARLT